MTLDRRAFLAAAAAAMAGPLPAFAATGTTFSPEQFGAKGDGVTNDTRAFSALSAEVNRRGGGTVVLSARKTYIVGAQSRGGSGRFGLNPDPILDFHDLAGPLVITGNGARLRCQKGLRFGTFDLASGLRADRPMPNRNKSEVATPYLAMIRAKNCKGAIAIRDVELDGNVGALEIGGKFGDKGWQIPANGLHLAGNRGPEQVDNIYSHHHALDGVVIRGDPDRSPRSRLRRLICRDNGRQGMSITGGRGYDFADCEFSRTGRSALHSPPGGGIDIEAEATTIRDVSFIRCKFLDNAGAGLTVPVGDSEDVRFSDCLFVGTTNWSAWPNKPRLVFSGCTFVGALVHAYGDPDPARAARFIGCRFTDNPALSPTGKVYAGNGGQAPIVQLAGPNVAFDGCSFELVGSAMLPATPPTVIYKDCKMSQRSRRPARSQGRFLGTTTIDGPVVLNGSNVEGTLTVNGRRLPRGMVIEPR